MSDAKQAEGSDNLQKAAAFMVGFSLFQLFLLVVSASKFSAGRFHIGQSYVALYINRMIISFRTCSLFGITLMTLYDQFIGYGISAVSSVLAVLISSLYAIILFVYCIGGTQGHITLYYWVIVATSFIHGLSTVCVSNVASGDIAFFLGSMPVAGILMSLYHITFLSAAEKLRISNVNYWIVSWQLAMSIVLSIISAIVWIVAYSTPKQPAGGSATGSSGNINKDPFFTALIQALSPILMVSFGFGLQNAFYPAIAPYKLAGVKNGYNISLVVLFTGAIPPLTILCLKEHKIGPNKPWNQSWHWHFGWIFYIVELICGILFIITLHYPNWSISRRIINDVRIIGVLTVVYDFCVQATKGIGANGAAMQGNGKHPKMSTFTTFFYSFIQLSIAFMGDGYIRTYRKYEHRDDWPTKHCSTKRAFWFWIWSATKVSYHTLGTAFTRDLRTEILGKKSHLFIVYEDAPPEDEDPLVDLPFIHKEPTHDNNFTGIHIFHSSPVINVVFS
ncbi:hypothetical protein BEWA_008900 [Theileria equi strain WA]|uniref:Uncharacterized protein n=1 Tax=Theileria equi strain WA TaxID=1537102 RepID=L0B1X5_THEEQ|nr:hypothetical protein BEWA_008900 [Theileria equi strain WA]AFZ81478.1 hypothetical protein BEWA_008900 [Theileria equi strain WA]|eukprot:XP_004831144.1 hypothetical protein BEWA_008900 [Theileria equi strain WA]